MNLLTIGDQMAIDRVVRLIEDGKVPKDEKARILFALWAEDVAIENTDPIGFAEDAA